MLLGFKRQFAPFVEEGSKTHTIRGTRKITPRVGETCHCYVDPRQKTMRLLGRFPCVCVEDIRIERGTFSNPLVIVIGGIYLEAEEAELFLQRDGFRDSSIGSAMLQANAFWDGCLPFEGHLIHWDFKPCES